LALWSGYVLLENGAMALMVKGYKYYSSLCPFSEDEVVCSHRNTRHKREGFSFHVCLTCSRYQQFMLAMEDEDERVMDEIDKERKRLDAIC
jgi:hypothetical protein